MGTLLDANGQPMAGYVVELHSDPVTTVTDSGGRYVFHDVDFTSHELIVKTPEGEKIKAVALAFSQGEAFGTQITQEHVSITYAKETATVNIVVQMTSSQNGAVVTQVSDSELSTSSGGTVTALPWIVGGAVAAAAVAVLIALLLKKRK